MTTVEFHDRFPKNFFYFTDFTDDVYKNNLNDETIIYSKNGDLLQFYKDIYICDQFIRIERDKLKIYQVAVPKGVDATSGVICQSNKLIVGREVNFDILVKNYMNKKNCNYSKIPERFISDDIKDLIKTGNIDSKKVPVHLINEEFVLKHLEKNSNLSLFSKNVITQKIIDVMVTKIDFICPLEFPEELVTENNYLSIINAKSSLTNEFFETFEKFIDFKRDVRYCCYFLNVKRNDLITQENFDLFLSYSDEHSIPIIVNHFPVEFIKPCHAIYYRSIYKSKKRTIVSKNKLFLCEMLKIVEKDFFMCISNKLVSEREILDNYSQNKDFHLCFNSCPLNERSVKIFIDKSVNINCIDCGYRLNRLPTNYSMEDMIKMHEKGVFIEYFSKSHTEEFYDYMINKDIKNIIHFKEKFIKKNDYEKFLNLKYPTVKTLKEKHKFFIGFYYNWDESLFSFINEI